MGVARSSSHSNVRSSSEKLILFSRKSAFTFLNSVSTSMNELPRGLCGFVLLCLALTFEGVADSGFHRMIPQNTAQDWRFFLMVNFRL